LKVPEIIKSVYVEGIDENVKVFVLPFAVIVAIGSYVPGNIRLP
jgi:hypothetical protein